MTKTKSAKTKSAKVETNVIDNFVAEVETTLQEVEQLTFEQVQNLTGIERINALKALQVQNNINAEIPKNKAGVYNATFLKGADNLGAEIYKNSVNFEQTSCVKLWQMSEHIKDAKGVSIGMTPNAFTRTFNTGLGKLKANRINMYDANLIGKPKVVGQWQIQEPDYFDNINLRISGLFGKTLTNKRFQYFFKDLLNETGKVEQELSIYINSVDCIKTPDFPHGHYNETMLFNDGKGDKTLEIFKAWLFYKGANENDLI